MAEPAFLRKKRELLLKNLNRFDFEEMDLVRISAESAKSPVILTPALEGVDLRDWVIASREMLARYLQIHGALLFRGFEIRNAGEFDAVVDAFAVERMHYSEGATPRTEIRDFVYTSTEFPAEHSIALHNELSYVVEWPKYIWFYCQTPAEKGGETPIADVRTVVKALDPDVLRRFEGEGWMLVRNFRPRLSLPWQTVFHTNNAAEVASYCERSAIEHEWISAEHLRTRQIRPATAKHPDTNELLWFNHIAFWHESSLPCEVRQLLKRDFGEENMPFNTYYGTGAPIPDEVIASVRAAYDSATVSFPWAAGDLLVLDNMLVAHGRNPYSGPRRILVAMGGPQRDRGVSLPG